MNSRSFTRKLSLLTALAVFGLLLAACQPAGPTAAPTLSPTEALPEATATPEPPRSLTVCLGQEPQTLFAYGSTTRSSWSVLEAVYDGFATADLAGPTRTDEFTNEVIRRVRTKVEVWSSLG